MKLEYYEFLFELPNGNKAKRVYEPGVGLSWFINGEIVPLNTPRWNDLELMFKNYIENDIAVL